MKKHLLFTAAIIISLSSCKKSNDVAQASAVGPVISSVNGYPVFAGTNETTGFSVRLISDSNTVARVELFLSPDKIRWTVKKPSTGTYTMYDQIGAYKKGAVYFFVFTKTDGTTVKSSVYILP